ncbi:hypothetical protein SERLADRAFT_442098 [Serpula lacrymans var. lacrymans S7.9]|uniref:Uncharacterized protein n=1 Tax=Serpula lacrymans var. lacrymans (strain S7.9) TaxID=578457 RepID=F8P8K4_SERL9|nr:uncharacterized protein SERLADRAFT_442098 [Serpula lacrymans var. lacrymans S7.9]EGO20760.1 hypothetical protein SERLADRAFT_442098 [Serpula lacrymans var. lacrymans S7.9]
MSQGRNPPPGRRLEQSLPKPQNPQCYLDKKEQQHHPPFPNPTSPDSTTGNKQTHSTKPEHHNPPVTEADVYNKNDFEEFAAEGQSIPPPTPQILPTAPNPSPIPPTSTMSNTATPKPTKFRQIDDFNGLPDRANRWMLSAKAYFYVNDDIYDSDKKKVFTALSRARLTKAQDPEAMGSDNVRAGKDSLSKKLCIPVELKIALLPDNNVPPELMDNVQYSSDIDQLKIERSNYVPDGKNLNISGVTDMEDDDDEHSSAEQEATIPLQTLEVVNASGSDIQENGLLAHALANVSKI